MKEQNNLSKDAQAIRLIKEALFDRKLSPGQKIIYRDLEEMFGMSKTPIINALIRLEQEGLVISHRNRGFYVRELKAEEIEQMYDLRVRFEEIAIDYAIDYGHKNDLVAIEKALKAYVSYPSEVYDAERFKLDIAFHLGVARMGKNPFLISMLNQFYQSAWIGFNIAFLTPFIARFKRDHEMLYRAMERKDRRMAKRVMRLHEQAALEGTRRHFAKVLISRYSNAKISKKGGKTDGKFYE